MVIRASLLLLLLGLLVAVRGESTVSTVRRAGHQLAAAASPHAVHLSTGGGTARESTCDSGSQLATQLIKQCPVESDTPSFLCCAVIVMTVEQDHCLCWVAEAPPFYLSQLSVPDVWEWYKACGGRRPLPQDDDTCEPGSPPPPPPPAEAPAAWPLRLWVAVGVLCAAALATTIFVALKLLMSRAEVTPGVQYLGGDVSDAVIIRLPQGSSGRGDVRPGAGKDAATAIATGDSGQEQEQEQEVNPVPPKRVEARTPQARARLPSPPPFAPPPLPVVTPPDTLPEIVVVPPSSMAPPPPPVVLPPEIPEAVVPPSPWEITAY